jgi:adenylate cyclase class 2
MKEFEAKFLNIDITNIKNKLRENGAKQVHGPLKFYRLIFKRCEAKGDNPGFVRVRNEGNKITMTTKIFNDKKYPDEREVTINESFEKGCEFLRAIGIEEKSYQETIREKWSHDLAHEITFDIVPGLPIYMEIDCTSEENLNKLIALLDLDKSNMKYGSFDKTYTEYYDIPSDNIIHKTPSLTFKDVGVQIKPYKNLPMFKQIANLNKTIDEKNMDAYYEQYKRLVYDKFLTKNHESSRRSSRKLTRRRTPNKRHKPTQRKGTRKRSNKLL